MKLTTVLMAHGDQFTAQDGICAAIGMVAIAIFSFLMWKRIDRSSKPVNRTTVKN